MKNQNHHSANEDAAEMHAMYAITLITKWVEERYPKISALTKSRLITQCLMEVALERKCSLN